jgi:hypothetical protein
VSEDLRPAHVCGGLLRALDAAEGRRKRRARDTTPDTVGLALRRDLLERAVAADPSPDDFEAWLVERCRDAGTASGPLRAVAQDVFQEWRLARAAPSFRDWLAQGAPSEDAR